MGLTQLLTIYMKAKSHYYFLHGFAALNQTKYQTLIIILLESGREAPVQKFLIIVLCL